uniref:GSDH domain-containing protein n=1 Tax=Angiostrongylus cantonensis TaxID=6313 RepID=A0A0K0CTE2_ANGCA
MELVREIGLVFISTGLARAYGNRTSRPGLALLQLEKEMVKYEAKPIKIEGEKFDPNIRVYKLQKDFSLIFRTQISLLSSPAGMYIEEESGDIWVALHPVLHQAFLLTLNPGDEQIRSPSQVLRVRIQIPKKNLYHSNHVDHGNCDLPRRVGNYETED